MENKEKTYRGIVKTTSLFGGVQVIQILTSIIRGKLVAIILGAAGMGINTIFTSAINMIAMISSFGLNFSAVRDISQSMESSDKVHLSCILQTFRRWMIFCSLLGLIITASGAKWISELSFGNDQYRLQIMILSGAVFFTILGNSQITILQGNREYKLLAKSSLIGSLFGLVSSVPFYYFFGEDGIVPALTVGAGIVFLVNWINANKIETLPVDQTLKENFVQGKEMAKLGIVLMISSFLGTLGTYLINSYVGNYSLEDVGFYGAGISITNQYIGLIFTSMSIDYFPRLSAVANDNVKMKLLVNQQGEIVTLLATPLIIGMMLTAPLIIRILLSGEFLVIREFICILAFGMFFKASSYAVGYISFAKGDKKLFFWLEGIYGNSMTLLLNLVGYYFGKLTGMAISFLVSFLLYFIIVLVFTRIRYDFSLSKEYLKMFFITFLLVLLVFFQTLLFTNILGYFLGGCVFVVSLMYAYKELDRRINIGDIIKSKLKC